MLLHQNIPTRDLENWIKRFQKRIEEYVEGSNDRTKYFVDFKKLLDDVEDGVKERTELMQFVKSILRNEQSFQEDGISIKFGKDVTWRYSFLRKQLYLSLFAMIGGVYDSSARLCMLALNKDDGIKRDIYICDIFFRKNPITKGHQDIIGPINNHCGYFLGVITFLRNLFIHRGESIFNGKNLFYSNDCRYFDYLNPEVLGNIEQEAHSIYEIKKWRYKDPDIHSYGEKPLMDLVNAYLLQADHGIGLLLSSLLAKHIGI